MNKIKVILTLTLMLAVGVPAGAQSAPNTGEIDDVITKKAFNKSVSFLGQKVKPDDTWAYAGNSFTHNPNFKNHALRNVLWFPDYRLLPFKASARARSADPRAASTLTDKGFTQDYSRIHGFYEHLSKWYYPYQPYYHYRDFYWMHNEENSKKLLLEFNNFSKNVMAATGRQRAKFNYSAVTLPDSARVYVPYDEHFRTAWTALYLSNPTSIKAFHYYAMTLLSSDPVLMMCYENIPPALGRTKLRTPHMEQFEKMRTGRDKMAQIIAVNYLKLDELCAFIKRQFQRFETAETNYGKLLGGWVGHVTYQNILKNHRSYKENVDSIHHFNVMDAAFLKNYPALRTQLAAEIGTSSSADKDTKSTAPAKHKAPVTKKTGIRRRR